MDTLQDKKKRKRPSKGMRTHNRRVKQEKRKTSLETGLKKSTRQA